MAAERDADLVGALRAGDESVFARLVRAWSPAMLRTAMALTGDRAIAEAVVRATWSALPAAVVGYRPPPGLRAWVCGRLLEELDVGEVASVDATGSHGPTVDRSRFLPPTHPEWPGHWDVPPSAWPAMEDARPSSHGVGTVLREALQQLPAAQRVVVGLRDVAACDVDEIAGLVQQPPAQVRHLLHHGRAQVRRRLELHFSQAQPV